MSCPHMTETIANHFEASLSPIELQKHHQHLSACSECRHEIVSLSALPELFDQWQSQTVPEWDRNAIMQPQTGRRSLPHRQSSWSAVSGWATRWAPLAASLVLAVAVLMQARLDVTDAGWSLSFGAPAGAVDNQQLSDYLQQYAEARDAETRQWVEAALRSHGETTADSVYQWMTWMEQQREADVERMEAGFQQLLDRDFQTVDSVRQLASYVLYQETP